MKRNIQPYTAVSLHKLITVKALVTIHYFEYKSNFIYAGEKHNFWEFVCVDKGELEIYNGSEWGTLKKGSIIFHQPNEFHSLKANGITAPNVIVVSFICDSPVMDFFRGKTLEYTSNERTFLTQIIANAHDLFDTPPDAPYVTKMNKKKQPFPDSEQLILLNLELLLLSLYRLHNNAAFVMQKEAIPSYPKESYENRLIETVLAFFRKNIRRMLTTAEVCEEANISYDILKKLFSFRYHCGPLEYFTRMRIEEAKTQIRSNTMNISGISEYLGYSSIHYFSRQFKKITGMSPTEYATSIKAKTELPSPV